MTAATEIAIERIDDGDVIDTLSAIQSRAEGIWLAVNGMMTPVREEREAILELIGDLKTSIGSLMEGFDVETKIRRVEGECSK